MSENRLMFEVPMLVGSTGAVFWNALEYQKKNPDFAEAVAKRETVPEDTDLYEYPNVFRSIPSWDNPEWALLWTLVMAISFGLVASRIVGGHDHTHGGSHHH